MTPLSFNWLWFNQLKGHFSAAGTECVALRLPDTVTSCRPFFGQPSGDIAEHLRMPTS